MDANWLADLFCYSSQNNNFYITNLPWIPNWCFIYNSFSLNWLFLTVFGCFHMETSPFPFAASVRVWSIYTGWYRFCFPSCNQTNILPESSSFRWLFLFLFIVRSKLINPSFSCFPNHCVVVILMTPPDVSWKTIQSFFWEAQTCHMTCYSNYCPFSSLKKKKKRNHRTDTWQL